MREGSSQENTGFDLTFIMPIWRIDATRQLIGVNARILSKLRYNPAQETRL